MLSRHWLRPLEGNFFEYFVIDVLKIETFDFFYEIIYPFEMLKECPGNTC